MSYYNRKTTRIPQYDYSSSNYYFITICTHNRRCMFGQPDKLNQWGKIAEEHIVQMMSHYRGVRIDKFVVMPNHIHMILVLGCENEMDTNPDCSQVIAQYKAGVSREIHREKPNVQVWQRSFHDHIIRNQAEYEKIWLYIEANPQRWDKDCFYIDPNIGKE